MIVALEHLQAPDVITVDPRAAAVGRSRSTSSRASRSPSPICFEARSSSRRTTRPTRSRSRTSPSYSGLRGPDERGGRRARLARHALRPRPTGSTRPDEYSSARDVDACSRGGDEDPGRRVRPSSSRSPTIAGGRTLHTWNDLLGVFPGVIGVKTGHTSKPPAGARWSRRARTGRRSTRRSSAARRARGATRTSSALLAWGLGQYRDGRRLRPSGPRLRRGQPARTGAAALALVAGRGRSMPSCGPGGLLTESASSPRSRAPAGRAGQVLGRIEVWSGRQLLGAAAARRLRARSRAPGLAGADRLVREPYRPRPRRRSSRDRHRHAQRRLRPHDHRAELPARPAPPRERRASRWRAARGSTSRVRSSSSASRSSPPGSRAARRGCASSSG